MSKKTEITVDKIDLVIEHNEDYYIKSLTPSKHDVFELEVESVYLDDKDIYDIVSLSYIEEELKKRLIYLYECSIDEYVSRHF